MKNSAYYGFDDGDEVRITSKKFSFNQAISYLSDKKSEYRCYAIDALGTKKDERAIPLLISSLKDNTNHSLVRWASAWALGEINKKTSVMPLIYAMLYDNDEMVVSEAACSLGKIGGKRAIGPLTKKHLINALASLKAFTVEPPQAIQ